jgi:hypothetical protein
MTIKKDKHVIKHELFFSIVTIPATIGANVLNIGKKSSKDDGSTSVLFKKIFRLH